MVAPSPVPALARASCAPRVRAQAKAKAAHKAALGRDHMGGRIFMSIYIKDRPRAGKAEGVRVTGLDECGRQRSDEKLIHDMAKTRKRKGFGEIVITTAIADGLLILLGDI